MPEGIKVQLVLTQDAVIGYMIAAIGALSTCCMTLFYLLLKAKDTAIETRAQDVEKMLQANNSATQAMNNLREVVEKDLERRS